MIKRFLGIALFFSVNCQTVFTYPEAKHKNTLEKTILKTNIVFLLVMTTISCQTDDILVCEESYRSVVTDVKGNNTGTVGETVQLTVEVRAKNGCSEMDGFNSDSDGNTKTYEPVLTYHSCGACPQNTPVLTTYLDFKTGTPGTYTLRFKSGEAEYRTFTLVIKP